MGLARRARRSVLAAQHHNGMNVGLLVNDGDRFGAAVNAVSPALPEPGRAPAMPEPADISLFTQQDTLLMQVLDLEYALRLKAQSVAAKSQGQYKAETFLLSPGELARFSSDSVKLQVLQHRMHQLDLVERDLDRASFCAVLRSTLSLDAFLASRARIVGRHLRMQQR